MTNPSPFDVGRQVGTNFAQSIGKVRDESTIERILAQAQASGDPEVLQQSIGQILSQVSPERQPAAVAYLQNTMQRIEQSKMQGRQKQAAKKYLGSEEAADLPPQVQAQLAKDKAKQQRLSQYGIGGDVSNEITSQGISPTQQNNIPNQSPIPLSQRFSKDQLKMMTGLPDKEIANWAQAELDDMKEQEKRTFEGKKERRKETVSMKQKIAEDAQTAIQSIQNKEKQLELIDSGDLNDPTFATAMDMLPGKLGRRFLSPKTVEYKASLVDEYKDLRTIFQGQTRVKEIELLEDKIADTYYTDEQKKAIIKARLESAQTQILRAELAAEIDSEMPDLGILEFSKELNKRMKGRLETNANQVIDMLKNVQNEADVIKSRPLDVANPQDAQIMRQILEEAGGNVQKAYKIAEQKGYKVKR